MPGIQSKAKGYIEKIESIQNIDINVYQIFKVKQKMMLKFFESFQYVDVRVWFQSSHKQIKKVELKVPCHKKAYSQIFVRRDNRTRGFDEIVT